VFVDLSSNSSFLLNLSEEGMAVQAMEVLPPGQALRFAFQLPNGKVEIKGIARVVWSDCSGRAGMKIVAISPSEWTQLAEWVRAGLEPYGHTASMTASA
jgi:hypothetical protein